MYLTVLLIADKQQAGLGGLAFDEGTFGVFGCAISVATRTLCTHRNLHLHLHTLHTLQLSVPDLCINTVLCNIYTVGMLI